MIQASEIVDIVLARVDNRLVHGQVGVVWTKAVQATTILVVDKLAAMDYVQQEIMNRTVEKHEIEILYWTVDQAKKDIHQLAGKKIFLITRDPIVMNELVVAGLPIKKVNLGVMHPKIGKRRLTDSFIYVDDHDIKAITNMKEQGIVVSAQVLPQQYATFI